MALRDYNSILDRIKPNEDDVKGVKETYNYVIEGLRTCAKSLKYDVDIVAGGSTAKNTFLKGDFDVDIFVRFKGHGKHLSDLLESMVLEVTCKEHIKYERVHGSRDYFQFIFKDIFFEIVPVKFVESIEDVENVTDMSPLHVFWAGKNIDLQLSDEIRIAKQFCKGIGVYGAESFIRGISGHVLDILVLNYGGFEKMLEEVSAWGGVVVVDIEKKHKDVFSELSQSKLVSPLIVIDPIDFNRNASAALSKENFELFKKKACEFIKNPSDKFFEIKKFSPKKLIDEKKDGEILEIIEVEPVDGKRDVVGVKVLKIFDFFKRHMTLSEFNVIKSDWFFGDKKSYLYYYITDETLEPDFVRCGPPITEKVGCKRFREKNENVFEKNGKLCKIEKRPFVKPDACFTHLLSAEYVKERCKTIRRIN